MAKINTTVKYFDDFVLGGYRLSELGGILYNNDGLWESEDVPTVEYVTETIPFKDGVINFGSRLNPRIKRLSMFFKEGIDENLLKYWLYSPEYQKFNYVGDTKYLYVKADTFNNIELYSENGVVKGLLDVVLVADYPYYKLLTDDVFETTSSVTGEVLKFKSSGNVECYPLVEVTPNGANSTISFKINDLLLTLSSVTTTKIYIDCESEEVYKMSGEKKESVIKSFQSNDYYDFPSLKPYVENTLVHLGTGISKIKINMNSNIK